MLYPLVWLLIGVIVMTGAVVAANRVRLARSIFADQETLLRHGSGRRPAAEAPLDRLPPPVARYLRLAIATGRSPVRTARVRHGGTLRLKPTAGWLSIRGSQAFSSTPPSFIWWGRIRMAPGLWIDVRDELVDVQASTRVIAESTVVVGDSRGKELDAGAAVRVLGEMTWFPTAFLDEHLVTWSAIDDTSARATLQMQGLAVHATFRFGADGLPTRVEAERYRDIGGGKSVLTPWTGRFGDFRWVAGLLVPFEIDAVWTLETGPFHALHFVVEKIEHDPIVRSAMEQPSPVAALTR